MELTTEQSRELLAEHEGTYVSEVCDACGQGIGYLRYTRKDSAGVWCSRECRDGAEAHEPGTCKHCGLFLNDESNPATPKRRKGTLFCDDACRKAYGKPKTPLQNTAPRKLSRKTPPIYAAFSSDCPLGGIPGHPGHRSPFLRNGIRP